LCVLSFATLAAVACGSSATTDVTAPSSTTRCQTTVRGSTTTFGPAGGAGSVNVDLSRECAWSASSQAPWIEITSPREGQGEATVNFRVVPNGDPVTRRASIAVNDARLDLSQDAAPCGFNVGGVPPTIAAEGGQVGVPVETHSACRWNATSESPFASVAPASGSGSGTVQVTVASNTGALRTIAVVIAGERRTVTQAAPAPAPAPAPNPAPPPNPPAPPPNPPAPPPPPPSCVTGISPSSRSFTFVGGTGSFQVSAPSTCAWASSTSATWFTITAGAATGNGEIRYLVLPNGSNANRQGTITVGSSVHTITQSGIPAGTIKLDGQVHNLSGNCPGIRFTIGETTIRADGDTQYRKGNCSNLRNSDTVEVEGVYQLDGSVLAKRIDLDR
jgi:hypothetical protein